MAFGCAVRREQCPVGATGTFAESVKQYHTLDSVMPWIDPHESAAEQWAGADSDVPGPKRSVYERAHETGVPFERDDDLRLSGSSVTEEFRTRDYTYAHVTYHLAVERDGRVKLLSKGHLWGNGEEHQRFRAQYRREGEPTDTDPFETYRVWMRYQFGTVSRDDDGTVDFQPTERVKEHSRELAWPEMYSSAQLRVAELELVRNPALARYVLRERGLWRDVQDAFRYNTQAFAVGP